MKENYLFGLVKGNGMEYNEMILKYVVWLDYLKQDIMKWNLIDFVPSNAHSPLFGKYDKETVSISS